MQTLAVKRHSKKTELKILSKKKPYPSNLQSEHLSNSSSLTANSGPKSISSFMSCLKTRVTFTSTKLQFWILSLQYQSLESLEGL